MNILLHDLSLTSRIPHIRSWMESKDMTTLSLREWMYIEKAKESKDTVVIKCFSCNRIDPSVSLRQAPSISRCADEIIESHHLCDNCCTT